eukprot:jgi/Mesvir1/2373/Mv22129-RA.1
MEFPVHTKLLSEEIEGVPTDIFISSYSDRLLVIASQLGGIGTLMLASREMGEGPMPLGDTFPSSPSLPSNYNYNVHVLMGKRDEPSLTACARHLVEVLGYVLAYCDGLCFWQTRCNGFWACNHARTLMRVRNLLIDVITLILNLQGDSYVAVMPNGVCPPQCDIDASWAVIMFACICLGHRNLICC